MDFLDFLDGAAAADSPAASPPLDDCDSSDDDDASSSPAAPSALALSLSRLRAHLSPQAVAQLDKQGFIILDGVFERTLVGQFADEISTLHAQGHTALNSTAFVREHAAGELPSIARLIPKPGVFETELTPDVRSTLQSCMPQLCAFHSSLPSVEAHLSALYPALNLSVAQGRSSLKLQMNTGARGCFPFHYDSPGGRKDSRRITMLLYLNEEWKEQDGGQLVLQPFLSPAVQIAPRAGRLVLFKSDALLHRVLPSTRERRCLTVWFHCKEEKAEGSEAATASTSSAASTAASAAAAAAPMDADAFAALWMNRISDPAWQRVLARAVYLDAWRTSFREAHGSADAAQEERNRLEESERVAYVSGGPAPSTGHANAHMHQRGAEPLVESLETDAARLEAELKGTGILELLRQTAEEQRDKTVRV